jgi:DNA (cytosine-5)-methyltransferase 1
MKILNLYCGIGGNRKLWPQEHEVTAVELNPEISKIYQEFFPNDKVIVADAHQYLLEHFKEFDFIWTSPPCPSHSRIGKCNIKRKTIYPDMKLYEEILLLKHYFKGKYVVENVIAFYKPLIEPIELQRHHFWTNFNIAKVNFPTEKTCTTKDRERLSELFRFNLDKYTGIDKRKWLRNCVLPELGIHILNEALNIKKTSLQQGLLF